MEANQVPPKFLVRYDKLQNDVVLLQKKLDAAKTTADLNPSVDHWRQQVVFAESKLHASTGAERD